MMVSEIKKTRAVPLFGTALADCEADAKASAFLITALRNLEWEIVSKQVVRMFPPESSVTWVNLNSLLAARTDSPVQA
jgi:hypothetical protein